MCVYTMGHSIIRYYIYTMRQSVCAHSKEKKTTEQVPGRRRAPSLLQRAYYIPPIYIYIYIHIYITCTSMFVYYICYVIHVLHCTIIYIYSGDQLTCHPRETERERQLQQSYNMILYRTTIFKWKPLRQQRPSCKIM